MVRALAYCAEDRGSGPTWNQWLEARSLSTQQQMGTRLKHWGDKGSEERNIEALRSIYPDYLIMIHSIS